jgi:hypothetical protein
MENNINVSVSPNEKGESVLVLREGAASVHYEHVPVRFSGIISSPFKWVDKRSTDIGKVHTYLSVDNHNGIIELIVDENNHFYDKITGKLEPNPDLVKIGINVDSREYDNKSLAKMFKMNRHLFADENQNMAVVTELNQLKVKVDQEIEKKDDFKGNTRFLVAQNVIQSNIPPAIKLNMPIFKGMDSFEFNVEIVIDADSWKCSLISPDLIVMQDKIKISELQSQVEAIKNLLPDIPVLYV